jgi:hypothetical protein
MNPDHLIILGCVVVCAAFALSLRKWQLSVLAVAWTLAGTAYGQLVDPAKEAQLRRLIPVEKYANDPDLILYTSKEMPSVFQHKANGYGELGFYLSAHNFSGNGAERVGNANEFPWKNAGGTDRCTNVSTFKFLKLPKGYPAVWSRYESQTVYGMDYRGNVLKRPDGVMHGWLFPVGTVFGEVLLMRGPDGYDYPFELRIRERVNGAWAVDVFRQFPTAESLLSAVSGLPPFDGRDSLIAHLTADVPLPRRTLADTNHGTRRAFQVTASEDYLPPISEEAATYLLTHTTFKSALGETWRGTDCFAPTTKAPWHIVPANSEITFVGTDQESCMRCHDSTLMHVSEFQFGRDWYGKVRGSVDKILSFNPAALQCVSSNGGWRPPIIRNIPGVIEHYDPAKHPAEIYHQLRDE